MAVLKMIPACKDYLWGGHRIADEYNVQYDGDILAEAWMLSCHPDGPSTIVNGEYAGKTLREYIESNGMEVLGSHCRRFRDFPILTKFIDAKDNLSIQVHPSNGYALQKEGQYGKTEMWYVLDAEEGAYLYYGFKEKISLDEFTKRIEENTLEEVLNAVPVHKGDVLFIESGTIHAIGKGILIAEIQQNSNVTYRVYDYGRVGKDGKRRDLHIEKALEVTNRVPIVKNNKDYPHLGDCDYFTVDKLNLDGRLTYRTQGNVNEESFLSILILDGEGTISNRGETIPYRKGDSFFLPAGSGDWTIEGRCDGLLTTIREKANPVRVGVDIGSSQIQIGLVNEYNEVFAYDTYPTLPQRKAEVILPELAQRILKLLDKNDISLDQCTGVGVGVPGTIDHRKGKVIYSNNIRWEDVEIVKELEKVILCPVRVANNADCAALGEVVAGAGKQYSDLVMFTLGNGVGGGIVINGKVFDGGNSGGGEVGHTVIQAFGRVCTCGRKGCLEAYASIPALLNSAKEKTGKEWTLQEVFENKENEQIREVLYEYTNYLGIGIVNTVNLIRPQMIVLGGLISQYAQELLEPLKKMIVEQSFGGAQSAIPELAVAQLGSNAGIIGAASL